MNISSLSICNWAKAFTGFYIFEKKNSIMISFLIGGTKGLANFQSRNLAATWLDWGWADSGRAWSRQKSGIAHPFELFAHLGPIEHSCAASHSELTIVPHLDMSLPSSWTILPLELLAMFEIKSPKFLHSHAWNPCNPSDLLRPPADLVTKRLLHFIANYPVGTKKKSPHWNTRPTTLSSPPLHPILSRLLSLLFSAVLVHYAISAVNAARHSTKR
jgi:hypothetical protein